MVNCSLGRLPPRFSLNSLPDPPHPPAIGRNPRLEPAHPPNDDRDYIVDSRSEIGGNVTGKFSFGWHQRIERRVWKQMERMGPRVPHFIALLNQDTSIKLKSIRILPWNIITINWIYSQLNHNNIWLQPNTIDYSNKSILMLLQR